MPHRSFFHLDDIARAFGIDPEVAKEKLWSQKSQKKVMWIQKEYLRVFESCRWCDGWGDAGEHNTWVGGLPHCPYCVGGVPKKAYELLLQVENILPDHRGLYPENVRRIIREARRNPEIPEKDREKPRVLVGEVINTLEISPKMTKHLLLDEQHWVWDIISEELKKDRISPKETP